MDLSRKMPVGDPDNAETLLFFNEFWQSSLVTKTFRVVFYYDDRLHCFES